MWASLLAIALGGAWVAGVGAQTNAPAAAPSTASNPPASPAAPAKTPADLPEVVVYLKEGQRITGLLVSSDSKQMVVRVAGINTRLPLESIERYDVLPPILERYQELRKSIPNEPDEIVRLAQWLQSREQYALALSEINRALELDGSHGEALRLKSILEQQLILRNRGPMSQPEKPKPEAANPDRPRPGEFPLLTGEDINLIKVYETDLASRPHVVVPREAAMRMLDAYAGHPLVPLTRDGREAVLRKEPLELLDLMFKLQARDYYKDVEVIDQPPAIRLFRENVARTWLMSCATSQCHGGLEAGRLVLYNRSPNSDPSVFTNLLILDRFRTRVGAELPKPGAVSEPYGRPLINWDNPERSPLLQMALPREDSLFPHPVVHKSGPNGPGTGGGDIWKPEFRSADDKLFKKAVEWIKAMYRPRPNYPVQYTPVRPFEPPLPPAPPAAATPAGTTRPAPGSGEPQPR
jgi:hypothetical protein